MTTFEKLDAEDLADIELENESGVFRVCENEDGGVLVELENKEGKKVTLNDLLPEGWKIVNYGVEAHVRYTEKELAMNIYEVSREGWKYFVGLLHEVGHIMEYENSDMLDENNPIRKRKRFSMKKSVDSITPEDIKEWEEIMSKQERDAWAYALRKLRSIVEDLGVDMEKTFGSSESLREYVHEFLLDYKEGGEINIKKLNIPEKEREKLLESISKLYTHKDAKKER